MPPGKNLTHLHSLSTHEVFLLLLLPEVRCVSTSCKQNAATYPNPLMSFMSSMGAREWPFKSLVSDKWKFLRRCGLRWALQRHAVSLGDAARWIDPGSFSLACMSAACAADAEHAILDIALPQCKMRKSS